MTTADVDFVCALNDKRELDAPRGAFGLSAAQLADPGHAGALACLGSADDHARMLAALAGNDFNAVQVAQVYLGRRPLREAAEIRQVALGVGRMPDGEAKVIALETLARHYVSDRESIEAIASGFSRTTSLAVQRAIAGILLRADLAGTDRAQLLRTITEHRVRSPNGRDIIDVLARRLQGQAATVVAVADQGVVTTN